MSYDEMLTLEEFEKLAPAARLDYVLANPSWVDDKSEEEIDEIGRLLCHASRGNSKNTRPIIGDANSVDSDRAEQERFEASVFGDPTKNDKRLRQTDVKRGEMPNA